MKKIKVIAGIIIGLFCIVQYSYGQISEGGKPYSFSKKLSSTISSYDLNVEFRKIESRTYIDVIEEDDTLIYIEPVIGESFPVNLNPLSHGTWDTVENNNKIWRLRINSNVGNSMMLIFDDFYLPEGTFLYVYSEDKSQLIGAFTSNNNNPQNKFTTEPIKGNSLILEYYEPNSINEQEHLNIGSVGLITNDNSDILTKGLLTGFGASDPCMINARCPQYANWCNQRRSVAKIYIVPLNGPITYCTGSLLDNERKDGKPFFLTAFHCLDDNEDGSLTQAEKNTVNNWLFFFNYESSGCNNPSTSPGVSTISGAIFLDGNENTDYTLLKLNNKPIKSYGVYYNGWSNDDDDMTSTGVCIHHPNADIKKITEWEKVFNYFDFDEWKIKPTAGSITHGSSGSPLFNSNGQVVGQCHSGTGFVCDADLRVKFGRFDKSWHEYGLSWQLNPNGDHSGSYEHYIVSMGGSETCKDNWYFENGNDLHTSSNVNFNNPLTIGTRQYDGVYNAKNSIVANEVTIKAGTSVTFEAGNEVVLNPGFYAEAGSNFVAIIGSCVGGCGNGLKIEDESNSGQSDTDMEIINNKAQ